jgi:hypothetical protein
MAEVRANMGLGAEVRVNMGLVVEVSMEEEVQSHLKAWEVKDQANLMEIQSQKPTILTTKGMVACKVQDLMLEVLQRRLGVMMLLLLLSRPCQI